LAWDFVKTYVSEIRPEVILAESLFDVIVSLNKKS
jgi:hypothetical protein